MPANSEDSSALWIIPLWGLFLLTVAFALRSASILVAPLVVVMLIAAALAAPTTWLSARMPRSLAAVLVMAPAIILILAGVFFLADPIARWMNQLPLVVQKIEQDLRGLQAPLKEVTDVAKTIEQIGQDGPPPVEVRIHEPLATTIAGNAGGAVISAAFALIVLYFALAFGDRVLLNFARLCGTKGNVSDIVHDVQRELGTYLLTITAINIGLGLVTGGTLFLIGMPDAVLWGVMAALLNYIPIAGSILGACIVGLVAYAHSGDWELPVVAMAVFYGLTQIESNFVTPVILGRRMRLNPLCVLLAVAFWGWLWGIVGAIVAVPLLAAVKVLTERFEKLKGIAQLISA